MEILMNVYLSNNDSQQFITLLTGYDVLNKKSGVPFNADLGSSAPPTYVDYLILESEACIKGMGLIPPKYKKYKETILKLYLEHFLAKNWETYSITPFTVVKDAAYVSLKENLAVLPYRYKKEASKVIRKNLVQELTSINGLITFIKEMRRYNSYNSLIEESMGELVHHYSEFKEVFETFMKELKVKLSAGSQAPLLLVG